MQTTLRILDQINVKFDGLDPFVRRRIVEAVKYFVPYARHTPSYKLGRWDGTIAFATAGGGTFINVLDKILPIVEAAGYDIDLDDQRPAFRFAPPPIDETFLSHKTWPEGHEDAGESIILRDYQVTAINTFLANPQSIQEISTGAGKTVMCGALSLICEPFGRSIIIVPSKSLVEQTEADYKNLELDVGVYYGDRKELGHKHTICTWQSLAALSKRTRREETDFPIDDFLADVKCVIVDEVHAAKAQELKTLLTGPFREVPIRWGFTGTIPKEEFDFMTLLVTLGPVVGHIKAHELQEKGVLAQCHVQIKQLKDDKVEFKVYDEEHDYLTSDARRLKWIADYIARIRPSGNTLILLTRIESGETLQRFVPDSVFVNGTVKTKKRAAEYKEVQTSDNKVIIATYGVAAVGINIPRIFNLVLIEPGKSFIRVIQSIGRGIRKAKDKDFVSIHDLCSSLKFSSRHLTKRKAFYKEANYPFTLEKVDYR